MASDRPSVLVVDDEQTALDGIEAVLEEHATVTTCASPSEALRILESSEPETFHVVCADYRMPMMNGIELLRRVSERRAHVGCLLITGSDEYFHKDAKNTYYVLLKPFSPDRLVSLIQQLARVAEMKRSVDRLQTGRKRPVKS